MLEDVVLHLNHCPEQHSALHVKDMIVNVVDSLLAFQVSVVRPNMQAQVLNQIQLNEAVRVKTGDVLPRHALRPLFIERCHMLQ
jgi:hypothetical protein